MSRCVELVRCRVRTQRAHAVRTCAGPSCTAIAMQCTVVTGQEGCDMCSVCYHARCSTCCACSICARRTIHVCCVYGLNAGPPYLIAAEVVDEFRAHRPPPAGRT